MNIAATVFDIDGTLCDTDGVNYMDAEPDTAMITLVNMLYDRGDYITIYTTRGSTSGIDWHDKTKEQLDSWGVKYHKLSTDKPAGDIIVDDISMTPQKFLEVIE